MGYPRDRGCATGGPSCLECPLPRCVHDEPRISVVLENNRANDARIAAAVKSLHVSTPTAVTVVAQENSVTRRTIYRMLQRHGETT